ncbi:MAG: 4-hydroxy-tetrahydrodipicolinate synthase [Candidatus Omnitrophica bacterium]|nr:4-hydroxy-tetrahydrodipicolinate synthase [Candidatus Omnitrophota bacterium]
MKRRNVRPILKSLRGSMAALVTPFRQSRIDEKRLRGLVEWHIRSGTSGLVPCGTTGESATLSYDEHEQVVELVVQAARGRIPVIAGTGSNNTSEAIRLTRHAQQAGADAALLINPYYNRPTQEGLYRHFKAVAEAVEIPLVLYNIPSRTGVNMEPETFARLRNHKNIVGVKEASGSLEQMARIKLLCGDDFVLISGDDGLTLPVLAIGGTGVISVLANIVPKEVERLVRAVEKGNLEEARRLHYKLLPLAKTLFIETNPIPVKTAMGMMGLIDPELRLPMCPMAPANQEKLVVALRQYGLLKKR